MRSIVLVFCLMIPMACSRRPAPVVLFSVAMPGHEPESVDALAADPLLWRMRMLGGVDSIQTISAAERADIYVTGRRDRSSAEFLKEISAALADKSADLPLGVSIQPPRLLAAGEGIPTVQIQAQERVQVKIRREKASELGIDTLDIVQAIETAMHDRPATDQTVAAVKATTLPSRSGTVTMEKIADVSLVKKPDHVVRKYP